MQRPQERAMLLCFVEALPLQPVQPAVSIRVCRAHSQGPLLILSKLWGGIGRHIPSHCSVAELSLRVAWSRSLAAEWIAGTRGKGRWTEFRLWVLCCSQSKRAPHHVCIPASCRGERGAQLSPLRAGLEDDTHHVTSHPTDQKSFS